MGDKSVQFDQIPPLQGGERNGVNNPACLGLLILRAEVFKAGSRIKDVMDEREKCSIKAPQIKQSPHVVTTTEHLKSN